MTIETLFTSYTASRYVLKFSRGRFIIIAPEHAEDNLVMLTTATGNSISSFQFGAGATFFPMPDVIDGIYVFRLYCRSLASKSTFMGSGVATGLAVRKENSTWSFVRADALESNTIFLETLRRDPDFLKKCTTNLLPHKDEASISACARAITKGCKYPLDHARAVHDYVAENIYYNMDSLKDKAYLKMDCSAPAVLSSRSTVCTGYSRLFVALLRSSGIPAVNIICQTLVRTPSGRLCDKPGSGKEGNHIVSALYADNRWMIVDSTYDSYNKYEGGKFLPPEVPSCSHTYFLPTLDFLSNTHRLLRLSTFDLKDS